MVVEETCAAPFHFCVCLGQELFAVIVYRHRRGDKIP